MSGTTPAPPTAARREELSVHPSGQPDPEGQAVLDFLRGEYAAAYRSVITIQTDSAPAQPAQPEPGDPEHYRAGHTGVGSVPGRQTAGRPKPTATERAR
jgi:hypothetical protein